MFVVCWFSRWREFRADAGGARFAGREHMISALKRSRPFTKAGPTMAGPQQPAFQALKISGKTAGLLAFSSPTIRRWKNASPAWKTPRCNNQPTLPDGRRR